MTKIQCKNINVNIIWDIRTNMGMEASAWVKGVGENSFSCFKLVISKPNASHVSLIYCISLVKTVSPNWGFNCNIWFLSSCAKYTKHKKKKEKKITTLIRPPISYTVTPPITSRPTIDTRLCSEKRRMPLVGMCPQIPLHPALYILNTDTHTHFARHRRVCAGTMLEVSRLLATPIGHMTGSPQSIAVMWHQASKDSHALTVAAHVTEQSYYI